MYVCIKGESSGMRLLSNVLSLLEVTCRTVLVVSSSEVDYQEKKSFIKENLQKTAVELLDFLSTVGHIWSILD